jgi:hypothetical protein
MYAPVVLHMKIKVTTHLAAASDQSISQKYKLSNGA